MSIFYKADLPFHHKVAYTAVCGGIGGCMLYISLGNVEHCSADKNKIRTLCPSVWIHYILDGVGYYNGERLTGGQAFIVYKNDFCEYFPDKATPWTYLWIRLEGEDSEKLIGRCGILEKSGVFSFDYKERLFSVGSPILEIIRQESASVAFREAAAKIILSLHKSEASEQLTLGGERWVNKAKEYVASNYHKKLTVEEIATALYIDRQYLRNLFVKYTGASTKEYLDGYRMARAKELLELPYVSVSDVAASVGYSDPLAFSKAFRKHSGESPKEYSARFLKKIR